MWSFSLFVTFLTSWLLVLRQVAALHDHYRILEVSSSASQDDIRKAYKKLVKQHHPDKGGIQGNFRLIAQAYKTLSNLSSRKEYDENLKSDASMVFDTAEGLTLLWDEPLTSARRVQSSAGSRSKILDIELSLEEIYRGTQIRVPVQKQILCIHCGASGVQFHSYCHTCGGTGVVSRPLTVFASMISLEAATCEDCQGEGVLKRPCLHCGGRAVMNDTRIYTLSVPRGIQDGHEFRFPGESDEFPYDAAGDLIFRISSREEDGWMRNGYDLYRRQVLTTQESLEGFSHEFTHINGSSIMLERKGATQPGDVTVMKSMGMPVYPDSLWNRMRWKEFGDLYITYRVAGSAVAY